MSLSKKGSFNLHTGLEIMNQKEKANLSRRIERKKMKVMVSKKDGSESILINHIMGDGFKNLVPFSSDDAGAIRIATAKGF